MTEANETNYLQISISGGSHGLESLNLAWLITYGGTSEEQKWIFDGALRMFKAVRKDDIHYEITTVTPRELRAGCVLVKDAQQVIDNIAEWMERN